MLLVSPTAAPKAIPVAATARRAAEAAQAMLILDASGSMWGQIQSEAKISIARTVVQDLMRDWGPSVRLGLTVYGHRRKGDCADIQTIVPVGSGSADQVARIVNSLNPKGKTPLSASVLMAAEAMRYTEEAATVILVTDGLETCDADPCAIASRLEETGVAFTAHVVGFDITEEESKSVRCIADLTGGKYFSASNAVELKKALHWAVEQTKVPARDKIRIALVDGGPVLKEGDAEFSFFAIDESGAASAETVSHNYGFVGFADVPSGEYSVEVEYGLVTANRKITVVNEAAEHVVVLNAGTIHLNAILSADTERSKDLLEWNVLQASGGERLTYDHGQQATFVLPPGDYRFTAAVSGVRKVVERRIAAGDQVDLDVDLRGGTVSFRAVLSENGTPAKGHFRWEAYSIDPDGTSRGERLDYSNQNSGEFVLPAGPNIIVFEDYAVKRELVLDVVAEETIDLELNINAAVLNYEFVDGAGKRLDGYPAWQLYPAGVERTGQTRLTYDHKAAGSINVPAEPLVMTVEVNGALHTWPIELGAGEEQFLQLTVSDN